MQLSQLVNFIKLLRFKDVLMGGLFLIFLIWSRFYLLSVLPASIPHDEVVYASNAKAYAISGLGLMNNKPWQLKPIHPKFAELPATVMSLGFFVTENGLLATHFSSAVMSFLLPLLIGWLMWGLWKDRTLALISTAITAISPLIWQFGRLGYDPFYSVFFYVAGGAVMINAKRWHKLLSLPFFFIGFFQYQGFKLLLLPWIVMIILLELVINQSPDQLNSLNSIIKRIKQSWSWPNIIMILAAVFITGFYGLVLLPQQTASSRLNRLVFTDEKISQLVNDERRLSLNSPLTSFISNKGTLSAQYMLKKFVASFDPGLLFIKGEPNHSGFAVWTHGIFYLIDIFFIILALALFLKDRKTRLAGLVLGVFTAIFTIPNIINTTNDWYMTRNMFSYVILMLIVAWGVRAIWHKPLLRWMTISLYLLSVANFSYQYFYRYPITHLDAGTFDNRIIARYSRLSQEQGDQKVVVYTSEPDMFFLNYLIYENSLNAEKLEKVREEIEKNQQLIDRTYTSGAKPNMIFELDNLKITNECLELAAETKPVVQIWEAEHEFCTAQKFKDNPQLILQEELANLQTFQQDHLSVPAVLDSGEKYLIHGDILCQEAPLQHFVSLKNFHQLNLAVMSPTEFCSSWITDLRDLKSQDIF